MNILMSDATTTEHAGKVAPICQSSRKTSGNRTLAHALWLTALLVAADSHASARAQDAGTPPVPAPGSEEGTGLTVTLVKAGGEDFSDQKRIGTPLGLAACAEGSIEVTLSGLPNTPALPYLEVWQGTGTGSCNQGDRGTRVTSSQNCTKLATDRDGENIADYSDLNAKVNISPVCALNAEQTTGSRQGRETLWFLLLPEAGSAEAATFYRAITLSIDTIAPDAPTRVTAEASGSDIRVTWAAPTSATSYWVIADRSEETLADDEGALGDAGPAADGCRSRYLQAGQRIDPEAAEAAGLLVWETSESELLLYGDDVDGAQRVSVAIVARDLAGNLSVLSAVRCTAVGDDDSQPASEGGGSSGTTDLGCTCSAPGAHAGTRSSASVALPISLLLAGAFARRIARRSGRSVWWSCSVDGLLNRVMPRRALVRSVVAPGKVR